jgi:hypothetical protein
MVGIGRDLEPITLEVVVLPEDTMTIESYTLRDDLRAWMKSPAIGLPEYSADPIVRRRVGNVIANFGAKLSPHAQSNLVVNSVHLRLPDKP